MCVVNYITLVKQIKEDVKKNGEICSVQEWEDSILLLFQFFSNY